MAQMVLLCPKVLTNIFLGGKTKGEMNRRKQMALLLLAMVERANAQGLSWIRADEMMAMLNMSKSSVYRLIDEMEKLMLIQCRRGRLQGYSINGAVMRGKGMKNHEFYIELFGDNYERDIERKAL